MEQTGLRRVSEGLPSASAQDHVHQRVDHMLGTVYIHRAASPPGSLTPFEETPRAGTFLSGSGVGRGEGGLEDKA